MFCLTECRCHWSVQNRFVRSHRKERCCGLLVGHFILKLSSVRKVHFERTMSHWGWHCVSSRWQGPVICLKPHVGTHVPPFTIFAGAPGYLFVLIIFFFWKCALHLQELWLVLCKPHSFRFCLSVLSTTMNTWVDPRSQLSQLRN